MLIGSSDEIAPVDIRLFPRRAGEVIARACIEQRMAFRPKQRTKRRH
jgi:hypothetical protein